MLSDTEACLATPRLYVNKMFFFLPQVCESVKKLPKCRYFRDVTWTLITSPDNVTQQIMHCVCPKSSVAYIIKRQAYQSRQGIGFQYSFACSPQSVSKTLGFFLCIGVNFSKGVNILYKLNRRFSRDTKNLLLIKLF